MCATYFLKCTPINKLFFLGTKCSRIVQEVFKMKKIKVGIKENRIWVALYMALLGVLMPIYFKHENFLVYESIFRALEAWDKEYLIIAVFKLVTLNTIRSFPNYIATFLIISSISIKYNGKENHFFKVLMITSLIPIIYLFIKSFYSINLPAGKSFIFGLLWLYYYSKQDLKSISIFKKSLGLLIFVMGIQWLDITTYFNFLKRGELTMDLDRASEFMGAQNLVNLLGVTFFLLLILFSILLLNIFKSQEKDMDSLERELENRFYKETRYLVHDLKTPLFSIRTLIEILKMQELDEKKQIYYSRIEKSLDKTNVMISEILKSNSKSSIKVSELFDFIFSYLSADKHIKGIDFENYLQKDYRITANRVLFSRAIINLIVNGYEASKDKVKIVLKDYKNFFYIIVEDNGPGISEEDIKRIFEEGVSGKNSTGLGLSFVNTVLEEHKFDIFFKRKIDRGTKVFIKVKGELENEK